MTTTTKATVAPHPRSAASSKATSKTGPSRKTAPRAAKPKRNKTDTIFALLRRRSGVTIATLISATGWQAHSIRAFISLAVSRRKLKIRSAKNAKGRRVYRLAK